MEIFGQAFEMLERYVLPHWPFVSVSIVLYVVGRILKKKVYTHERARNHAAFRWLRATMALHPMIAGFFLGLIPDVPVSPGVHGTLAASIYYMLAGACASVVYDTIRGHQKWNIQIAGLTDPPPAAPAQDDIPTNPSVRPGP